mgnify:CR=1 FL=1
MALAWVHETPAVWDDRKARILDNAAPSMFKFGNATTGELLPDD